MLQNSNFIDLTLGDDFAFAITKDGKAAFFLCKYVMQTDLRCNEVGKRIDIGPKMKFHKKS